MPFEVIDELEKINVRTEYGTDLFIPAFDFASGKNDWTDDIIIEFSVCNIFRKTCSKG